MAATDESTAATRVSIASNGGSRPVPDPTSLTDAAIEKAIDAVRDWATGQFAIRDERLNGIDQATKLRLQTIDHLPDEIDRRVAAAVEVIIERFKSVDKQFDLNALALVAALSASEKAVLSALTAQKEAATKQDEANQKAIDKSEAATIKTIETNLKLSSATTDGLTKSVDEVKTRLTTMESVKVGAVENKAAFRGDIAIAATAIGVGIAVAGFFATRGTP